jgi:hypothetical protein
MPSTLRRTSLAGTLYRLIYRSRTLIAQAPAEDPAGAELQAILEIARRNNKAANVTGAMLLTQSGFAQVLEGPRDVVEKTFERIGIDPRHTDVMVLSFTPIERRAFPHRPMGFCAQPSQSSADPPAPSSADPVAATPRSPTGSDVLRLIEHLLRGEDTWIAV